MRQSTKAVEFNRSIRTDEVVLMTSGRAGKVVPVGYVPLLPGDSCAGRVGVDIQLGEMPRPLLNAVTANVQAWFVPKTAMPQFSGPDEIAHAFSGKPIRSLGRADRPAQPFYTQVQGTVLTTALSSEFFKTLGIHVPAASSINADLIDAFNLIYNFRLAAHSSRLALRKYSMESTALATSLPPAFWPSSRFANVVPDYERALIVGNLDLDVSAGSITLSGSAPVTGITQGSNFIQGGASGASLVGANGAVAVNEGTSNLYFARKANNPSGAVLDINAQLAGIAASMAGSRLGVTLAQIDMARTTQAFAKVRAAFGGNDTTGFDNDETLVALWMQGLQVDGGQLERPWMLDSKRVPIGFSERFATDGTNLDKSVTQGRASVQLSLNVPVAAFGGVIMFTVEVLPERLDERMSDEWLLTTRVTDLPNALRDVQRVEPVDLVPNRRLDAKHTAPAGLYGYEPMNDKWNRSFTRLGGVFYQATPGAEYSQQRSAIWQIDLIDPAYSSSHFLAPVNFPHTVFSDTIAPAFEVVCRHVVKIAGLTQIGDILSENDNNYGAIAAVPVEAVEIAI